MLKCINIPPIEILEEWQSEVCRKCEVDKIAEEVIPGIYIDHFSFSNFIIDEIKEEWDSFNNKCDYRSNFGVCDCYEQILKKYPELENDKNRNFVVSLIPIYKKDQPESCGWRWHKWGEYIGTKTPTTEYLYDEPVIESVFCFHIYELY